MLSLQRPSLVRGSLRVQANDASNSGMPTRPGARRDSSRTVSFDPKDVPTDAYGAVDVSRPSGAGGRSSPPLPPLNRSGGAPGVLTFERPGGGALRFVPPRPESASFSTGKPLTSPGDYVVGRPGGGALRVVPSAGGPPEGGPPAGGSGGSGGDGNSGSSNESSGGAGDGEGLSVAGAIPWLFLYTAACAGAYYANKALFPPKKKACCGCKKSAAAAPAEAATASSKKR